MKPKKIRKLLKWIEKESRPCPWHNDSYTLYINTYSLTSKIEKDVMYE